MSRVQLLKGKKIETISHRKTSEEIDRMILDTLSQEPLGIRSIMRETGLSGSVVIKHVRDLEDNMRIRWLRESEYPSYSIHKPAPNTTYYTLVKGDIASTMWHNTISELDALITENNLDTKRLKILLSEFLPINDNLELLIDYHSFCEPNEFLTLLRVSRILIKNENYTTLAKLTGFLKSALTPSIASKELARNSNGLIDSIVNEIRNNENRNPDGENHQANQTAMFSTLFHLLYIFFECGGGKVFEVVQSIVRNLGKEHKEEVIKCILLLGDNSKVFQTLLPNIQGKLRKIEHESAENGEDTTREIIRKIRRRAIILTPNIDDV